MTTATAAPDDRSRSWLDVPWHPTLFAVTIVLAYWLDTVVSPYAAFRSFAAAAVLGLALTLLGLGVTRSAAGAGLLATGVLLLLYSKHVVGVAVELSRIAPLWAFALWLALFAVAVGLAARLARRRMRRFSAVRLNRILNWAAVIYLGASIGLGVTSGKFGHAIADLTQGAPAVESPDGTRPVGLPDIYLILLDGYPRADVLADTMGFDNQPFVDDLERRGFEVATESRSTYLWTQQSLTSMLHMDYVEEIPDFQAVLSGRAARQPTLRDIVNENPTFELARDAGYEVVSTGYEFEELALRQSDVYVDPGFVNEFEIQLLSSTFAGDIVGLLLPDFASSQHREWIDFQVRTPVDLAKASGATPRLVIGHVSAPHQPTVFGANGDPIVVPLSSTFYADSPIERGQDSEEFVDRYRAQLEYLNARFLGMVDGILAASSEPPVIVLWADHGSSTLADWTAIPHEAATDEQLRERTSTLFAALTPGRDGVFRNDIEPFDIFRAVADAYLGTDLGTAARSSQTE